MAEVEEWFDLLSLIYNLSWLIFLIKKHYGQVTTRAGHIFELNVLLTNTINEFLWIIFKDLQALPSGTMSEMLFTTMSYNYWIAVAGSQIETAIFLKTLEVGTMMTNTAGKIILVLTFCSIGLAVTTTLAILECE